MNVNSLCSFTTSKKWTKLTDNSITTAAFCTSIEHVFDVFAVLLHYKLHTTQPFTNTLLSINKTWLGQFLPCQCRLLVSVCQLRQNFIDSRPSTEGHPDDIIHLIQVWAIRRPHSWLNDLHVLVLQVTHCVSGHVGRCGCCHSLDGATLIFQTDSNK